jgi:hypothetical protein
MCYWPVGGDFVAVGSVDYVKVGLQTACHKVAPLGATFF